MAIKTQTQLLTDATNIIKDNGGADNSKTKGINLRTLVNDIIDTLFGVATNAWISLPNTTLGANFQQNSVIGSPSSEITASSLIIDLTDAVIGNKIILYKTSAAVFVFNTTATVTYYGENSSTLQNRYEATYVAPNQIDVVISFANL